MNLFDLLDLVSNFFGLGFETLVVDFLRERLKLDYSQAVDIASIIMYLPFILFAVTYVYIYACYRKIAINLNQDNVDISLIPFFGPLIIAFRTSDSKGWSFLLFHVPLVGTMIFGALLNATLTTIMVSLATIVLIWFIFSWHASMYENCGKPRVWSWLILIMSILSSVLFFGGSWLSRFLENESIQTVSMWSSIVIYLITAILSLIFIGKAAFSFEGSMTNKGNLPISHPPAQTYNYGTR